MSFWKRAGLYLRRKKGRVILLTVLLFLMSCSVLIGFSFKESAEKEADSLRQSLASGFVMQADSKNETYYNYVDLSDGRQIWLYDGPMITESMIKEILSIDGVEDYMLNLSYGIWTDLDLKPGAWADTEPDKERIDGAFTMLEEDLVLWRHETGIWACRNGKANKNFRTGALTISEGRNIQDGDQYKAVISEYLAEENGLSVGETFNVELKEGLCKPSDEPMKTWGEPLELEIVGVFHANFKQQVSDDTYESQYIENMIYTDMDTYAKLQEMEEQELQYDNPDGYTKVEFLVDDPMKIDSIIQQIKDSKDFNLENINISIDDSAYQTAMKPYHQIRVFSIVLLIIGSAGIGIVLFLLMKLWTQGRKHEAGILLSIGIGKRRILCQMLTECFIMAVAALFLSLLLSGTLIDKCADVIEQVTAPNSDTEPYEVTITQDYYEIVAAKTSSDEVVVKHTVSITAVFFAVIFVCVISGSSVCLSFTQISSLEPKKLLRSM